jgi:1,4-dihydroxy-2-naphthoate octaprenyltransferase
MNPRTKAIIVTVLLVVAAGLGWLLWVQTRLLVLTLALFAVALVILYFVVRKT